MMSFITKISRLLFVVFITIAPVKAQLNLDVSAIPDSLKENAYSIVRHEKTEYTWQNMSNGDEISTRIVTIINEKGKDEAHFVFYSDMFRDIKKFSGEVYDATGKLIRKIKKGDLRFTEYSNHLASDGKYHFYECHMPYYPFTVKYEWEVKHKNGIIGFPNFYPQESYNQSVEKAVYCLNIPEGTEFKYKAVNMKETPQKDNSGKIPSYIWEVEGLNALEPEPFGPSLGSQLPTLYLTPIKFNFGGVSGDISDWKSFGDFQYGLLKGRDQLPPAIKNKVTELTKDAPTDREKVKRIYDYLAETTRYVSIQLGIGGFQPMPASEVFSTGFGDCKALTNYMMAMLKELNIPSHYTIISTNRRYLLKNFASANQMNHVILQVPLPGDTLWLECTNPQFPFGYVHNTIAGHDAILLKETGGELYTLPTYPDSLNMENHNIKITLSESGKVTAKVDYSAHLFQYQSMIGFTKTTPKEQIDYLRRNIKVTQAKVSNVNYTENKESYPSINILYDVESEQYGSKTGNRLFIPVNPFREGFGKLTDKDRKNDIFINYGYNDNDIITIQIPENYSIESLPKPVVLMKEYGTFMSVVQVEENGIKIIQKLHMRPGKYDKSRYSEFVQFCKGVTDNYGGKIILKKN